MAFPAILENAIHAVAPSAQFDLAEVNGHWSGIVVALEFDHMTHLDRQRSVWQRIRQDLGAQSTLVGTLILYSPEEADAVDPDE